MSTKTTKHVNPADKVRAKTIRIADGFLVAEYANGREVKNPLTLYPTLLNASEEKRNDWISLNEGEGFHWPQLDLDLSARGIALGIREWVPKPSDAILEYARKLREKGVTGTRKSIKVDSREKLDAVRKKHTVKTKHRAMA